MKKLKKALVLFLCAVLLVAGSVAGTLAYLQSNSEVVKNTFTVGELEITLDEAKTDEYGKVIANADRVTANTYKLVPGHTYVKDPTVHVAAGSEECYLFVEVVDGLAGIQDDITIAAQMTANGWAKLEDVDNVWFYGAKVDARESAKDVIVFENFTLKGTADVSGYATETNTAAVITITAYAIQVDGFDSAAEAWDACF